MRQRRKPILSIPGLETIESAIILLRGERVVLDTTIASLYGVSVSQLNQAVRRNRARFPDDFLLELSWRDTRFLRSQFVILEARSRSSPPSKRGLHAKFRSLAFTEQGIAMLSGLLRSPRAVRVNIEIMRAFVRLRRILTAHPDLARKLEELEVKVDEQFGVVFKILHALDQPTRAARRRLIGFRTSPSAAMRDCISRSRRPHESSRRSRNA